MFDAFYRAALEAGGKDNGAPGLRPNYHANYYKQTLQQKSAPPRIEVSLDRRSACLRHGTHHGPGSLSDTLEECSLPA
jgi:hypothetical protein